jgi:hypothetical protein
VYDGTHHLRKVFQLNTPISSLLPMPDGRTFYTTSVREQLVGRITLDLQ